MRLPPSGCRHVFMGLDTRRWTSCVCDHFWSFLLPPVFLSQIFCRVSVPRHKTPKEKPVLIVEADWTLVFIRSRHNKTLTKKEKKMMTDYSDYIQDVVQTKKVGLFYCMQFASSDNYCALQWIKCRFVFPKCEIIDLRRPCFHSTGKIVWLVPPAVCRGIWPLIWRWLEHFLPCIVWCLALEYEQTLGVFLYSGFIVVQQQKLVKQVPWFISPAVTVVMWLKQFPVLKSQCWPEFTNQLVNERCVLTVSLGHCHTCCLCKLTKMSTFSTVTDAVIWLRLQSFSCIQRVLS